VGKTKKCLLIRRGRAKEEVGGGAGGKGGAPRQKTRKRCQMSRARISLIRSEQKKIPPKDIQSKWKKGLYFWERGGLVFVGGKMQTEEGVKKVQMGVRASLEKPTEKRKRSHSARRASIECSGLPAPAGKRSKEKEGIRSSKKRTRAPERGCRDKNCHAAGRTGSREKPTLAFENDGAAQKTPPLLEKKKTFRGEIREKTARAVLKSRMRSNR